MAKVVVVGDFDNIRSREVRFLDETSKLGQVYVYLWADDVIEALSVSKPDFPQEERKYFLNAVRYVNSVRIVDDVPKMDELPLVRGFLPDIWAVPEVSETSQKREYCAARGIGYSVIQETELKKFPQPVSFTAPRSEVRRCWLPVATTGSTLAAEFKAENTEAVQQAFADTRGEIPVSYELHDEFKLRVPLAIGLIRTGETIQYANMILGSA